VSRRVAREIQIFVVSCRSTSRELHMAVEGVGQTDRQLHLALEVIGRMDRRTYSYTWQWRGWTDGQTATRGSGGSQTDGQTYIQLHVAVEGLDRRTDKYGSGGSWMDGRTSNCAWH
jgi:hypothetical protein